jgi:hypothetical protein
MADLDPNGERLPIKIDTASNGEFVPLPLTPAQKAANAHARERVGEVARRRGIGRREFLTSLSGAAATLLALDEVQAAHGARGGRFALAPDAAFDDGLATAELGKREFVFDVQTHCVDPSGNWATGQSGRLWERNLLEIFGRSAKCEDGFVCYSARQLLKEVYLDSDTDVAVVSALWGAQGQNPTPIDYAAEARAIIEEAEGSRRCLIHGGVMPNEPGDLERMEEQAKVHGVVAWKLYPQWGPDGVGYHMDDPIGLAFLERARELDVRIVAAHRGLPLPGLEYEYSKPADIARVAATHPDMTFLCYHSGFEPRVAEGPYDPDRDRGVDRLIRAHAENGFEPNQGNLYAELGSVWRHYMSKPDQAAHFIGKLLVRFGEERILWGTDAIWYGSPQDQIQAFRSFQISDEFQERYGYPRITDAMRAKVFGLNGARVYGLDVEALRKGESGDRLATLERAYAERRNPSFRTYGPRTRREFFAFLRANGGRPG